MYNHHSSRMRTKIKLVCVCSVTKKKKSCWNMATERRTYILIVLLYIHILQENIITFNPIMSNVCGNLILFILVTFAFPTNKFYPALCGRAWSLSFISPKQLFLFTGINVHSFRDDTCTRILYQTMSNWIRDCFISGFFVCYAGFLLCIKVQDVLYQNECF
jgi:hypothetical protein